MSPRTIIRSGPTNKFSDNWFRSLIENSNDVISLLDDKGIIIYSSPSITRILGYSDKERIGHSIFENIHAEDLPRLKNAFARLVSNPELVIYETVRYQHQDGGWRWMEGHAKNLLDDPVVHAIVINFRDVTERKQVEAERERLLNVIDASMNEIYIFAPDTLRFMYLNNSAIQNLGYSFDQLKTMTPLDLKPEFTEASFRELIEPLLQDKKDIQIFHTVHRRADASLYPVEVHLQLVRRASESIFLAVIIDITDRKQAEEALRSSKEQLSNAMKIARAGHWEYDVASDLFTFNDHFYALFHTTADEIGSYTMSSTEYVQRFVHPDDMEVVSREVQAAIESTDPDFSHELEHRIIFAGGEVGHMAVRIFTVKDEKGRTIKTYGVNQDITSRKMVERQLTLLNFALNHAHEASYLIDENSRFVNVNDEACRALGYARNELLNMNVTEIDPDYSMEQWKLHWEELKTRSSLIVESRYMRKDGSVFPIEVNANYIEFEGKGYDLALVRNITERKVAYDKILRLNRVYKMLSEINSLIVYVQDRQELFEESCRIAVEAGGFRLAWIGTVSKENRNIVPQASSGYEDGYLQHIHITLAQDDPGKDSASGKAVHIAQPAVHNDIAGEIDDFPWKQEALKRGYNAAAALPLIIADEVVGVMSFYSTESGFFDDEEMKLLRGLVNDISYALQNIMQREQFEYLSSYDPLTGLANRTLFNKHLNSVLGRARKNKKKVALLVCDLKQFRHINNVYGPHAGDRILQETAKRLRELTSDPVNIGRISNDNFVMILHDVRDVTGVAYRFENALFPSLNKPFVINGNEVQINFAGGIAVFPADGDDAEELYSNAEAALKRAKQGGEQYLFYRPEMTTRIAETLQLESKLRMALKKEQFVLHYQPKINTLRALP